MIIPTPEEWAEEQLKNAPPRSDEWAKRVARIYCLDISDDERVGELLVELPLANGGLAGKQDPLELVRGQVDQGAPPGAARRAGTHASSMQ